MTGCSCVCPPESARLEVFQGFPPDVDQRWRTVEVWPSGRVLTANQVDDSIWVPTFGANRVLPSGVYINASSAVTINGAVFGCVGPDNPVQIATFQISALGAWWATAIGAISFPLVMFKFQNGNATTVVTAELRFSVG